MKKIFTYIPGFRSRKKKNIFIASVYYGICLLSGQFYLLIIPFIMFWIYDKSLKNKNAEIEKPNFNTKISMSFSNIDQATLSKLPKTGNGGLIFHEDKIYHEKYGYLTNMPEKKYARFKKLTSYTYFWGVYTTLDYVEDRDGDLVLDDDTGMPITKNERKVFSLKIY